MTILGIETSCDETSVSIIEGKKKFVEIKSNVVASSLAQHAATGGIIPENAARAQLKFMLPVLTESLGIAFGITPEEITSNPPPIDAIAVTYGPGLIGPLLIGVETARTLSCAWNKPVIPVNHMLGHIYANFIREKPKSQTLNNKNISKKLVISSEVEKSHTTSYQNKIDIPKFPLIALVVSGGHTDLIYMKEHGSYEVLGGTRDDAAGEAFDKIGRLLGLPYPAGPIIEKRAKLGNAKKFNFPRPLMNPPTYEFSFSGLKTAVLREVKNTPVLDEQTINDLAACTQQAITEVLVKKTLRAVLETNAKSLLLSGGVAANQMLRETFQSEISNQKTATQLHFPPKNLCTDNAAMIASAAYFNYNPIDWRDLSPNPELYYE